MSVTMHGRQEIDTAAGPDFIGNQIRHVIDTVANDAEAMGVTLEWDTISLNVGPGYDDYSPSLVGTNRRPLSVSLAVRGERIRA